MENKYILVSLDYCWADEFDVNALWATTRDEYNNFLEELSKKDINDREEIYFGTNEAISFYDYDDIYRSLTATNISESFYNEFIKVVGECYGLIDIPELLEHFVDAEEEEE